MALSDSYRKVEDKYYDFLDSLDKKGVPVYSVVDVIEANNIPSLPVFTIILVLLLAWIYISFAPAIAGQSSLQFKVLDEQGNGVQNALVSVSFNGKTLDASTSSDGSASFNVPLNSSVSVAVNKSGFTELTQNFTVNLISFSKDLTLRKLAALISKTIKLQSLDGSSITDPVSMAFTCSNVVYSRSDSVIGGEITLNDIPAECGNLYVSPEAAFKSEESVIALTPGTTLLKLSPVVIERGKANVFARDEQGNPVSGALVTLYTSNGFAYNSAFTGEAGSAEFFEVPVDVYYAGVSHESGRYRDVLDVSNSRSVAREKLTNFEVTLLEGTAGKIRVKVQNKVTGLPVSDASVRISKNVQGVNQQIGNAVYTDLEGKAELSVSDSAAYTVDVDHPNYLKEVKREVRKTAEKEFTLIELSEATAANSRTLTVIVLDENRKPIQGVRTVLQKDGVPIGQEKITSANGLVNFENLEEGFYQVYVVKAGFNEKLSDQFSVRLREENVQEVILPIGSGTFELTVLNEEFQSVSGATVSLFDSITNEKIGADKITNTNGVASFNVRADKSVYAKVSSNLFLDYVTVPSRMGKDATITDEVVLVDEVPVLSVELLGLFIGEQETQGFLTPGQKYTARLQLRIPSNTSFEEAGIHLRTGKSIEGTTNIMEADPLYIKEIKASNSKIIKGTSFTPNLGFGTDIGKLTNGSSKWSNVTWRAPQGGVYEVEAELIVNQVSSGELLEINYRGYGKTGTYVRDPRDDVLGSLQNTALKQELYANSKQRILPAGPSNLCSGNFCNVIIIEDLSENIESNVVSEFPAKVQSNYKLLFTLINNSSSTFTETKLKIINDSSGLEFSNYKLNVRGRDISGSATGSGLELDLGSVNADERVFGELDFKTVKEGANKLSIELISGKEKVYDLPLIVSVSSAKKLEAEVVPKTIVPFIDNAIALRVTDTQEQKAVANALVRLKLGEEIAATGNTDFSGRFQYTLTAPSPGQKFTLEIEKNGFLPLIRTHTVSESILDATPSKIEEILFTTGVSKKSKALVMINTTEIPLTITKVEFNGFPKLVRFDLAENYIDRVITPKTDANISFDLGLTAEGIAVEEQTKLLGTMDVHLYSDSYKRTWVNSIPVEVRIGFGAELDSVDCLIVDPLQWNIFTEDEQQSLEVLVKNICSVDGRRVDLSSLEARIVLGNENELGKFELEQVGSGQAVELKNTFQRVTAVAAKNSETNYLIKFTPKKLTSAIASPKIVFKAVNRTANGDEVLERVLQANVQINELTKCLTVRETQSLIIESCPLNQSFNLYQFYNPSSSSARPPYIVSGASGTFNVPQPTGPSFSEQPFNNGTYPYDGFSNPYMTPQYQQPQQSFTGCGEGSFRIQNNCSAAVEVSIDAPTTINVSENKVDIDKGGDAVVRIGQSYRIGKYPIKVSGKIKGSSEASKEIKTLDLIVKTFSEIGSDCIKLQEPSDGKFKFNDFIQKPVKGKLRNECWDQGVRLNFESVTTNSFLSYAPQIGAVPQAQATEFTPARAGACGANATEVPQTGQCRCRSGYVVQGGGCVRSTQVQQQASAKPQMISGVIAGDPYELPSGDGKTVQILEFRIDKDLSYQQYQNIPRSTSPLQFVGNLRGYASGAVRYVEEDGSMTVNYTDAFGQKRAKRFLIKIQDLWNILSIAGPFDPFKIGDPSIDSKEEVQQKCIDSTAFNEKPPQELDDSVFFPSNEHSIEKTVLLVADDKCGSGDTLSIIRNDSTLINEDTPSMIPRSIYDDLKKRGVTLSAAISGKNVILTIERSPDMSEPEVNIDFKMKANATRGIVSGFTGLFTQNTFQIEIPVKLKVKQPGTVAGFSKEQTAVLREINKRRMNEIEAIKHVNESNLTQEEKEQLINFIKARFVQVAEVTAASESCGITPGQVDKDLFSKVFWNWEYQNISPKIPEITFSETNPNAGNVRSCSDGSTYCDATQFGIELDKRITKIKDIFKTSFPKPDSIGEDCKAGTDCVKFKNSLHLYKLKTKQLVINDLREISTESAGTLAPIGREFISNITIRRPSITLFGLTSPESVISYQNVSFTLNESWEKAIFNLNSTEFNLDYNATTKKWNLYEVDSKGNKFKVESPDSLSVEAKLTNLRNNLLAKPTGTITYSSTPKIYFLMSANQLLPSKKNFDAGDPSYSNPTVSEALNNLSNIKLEIFDRVQLLDANRNLSRVLESIESQGLRENFLFFVSKPAGTDNLAVKLNDLNAEYATELNSYILTFNEYKNFWNALFTACLPSGQADPCSAAAPVTINLYNKQITVDVSLLQRISEGQPFFAEKMEVNSFENREYVIENALQGSTQLKDSSRQYLLKEFESIADFNAYLMKDKMNKDWNADFTQVYSQASDNFKDLNYFNETNSSIAEEFEFSTPGKYNIFISHVPTQSNWPWIGLPNTTTKIWIRHKLESTEGADNSLFYLPFDGELGLAGDNNRVGYGVSLKADSNQLKVNLPSAVAVAGERPLKLTAKDGGDNGNLITFKKNDLSGMVSDGLLFSFNNAEKKLTLSPSMPAPLGLVVAKNLSEENEVVINAIYSFFTSGNQAFNPSEGGEVFAVNWSIMGFGVALEAGEKEDLKVDFFGNSISDTRMKDEKEGESANTFKVEWSGSADAARNGTLMLAGVLYHPISKSPFISVSRDSTALAVIRNRDGQRSATDAVQSINLTDIVLPSGVQKENLDVLESLKKLNEEGFLCSTSNQNSLELRWHEDKIIKESGIIDRLNEERTRLQAR